MPNPTPNDEIIFASHLNRSSLALGTPVLVSASFTATESDRVGTNPSLLAGHTQYVYALHVCTLCTLYVCTHPRPSIHNVHMHRDEEKKRACLISGDRCIHFDQL